MISATRSCKAAMQPVRRDAGFTLIELSIVLVVIGLIVGGILLGQNMIRAAEIRAQISQFEKLTQAVLAFKLKYNGIPGDLVNPGQFSFFAPSGSGGTGLGDGNGLITNQGTTGGDCVARFSGEITLFYYHLSQAGMIEGSYSAGVLENTGGTAKIGEAFPRGKINTGSGVLAMGLPSGACGTSTGTPQTYADKNFFHTGATNAAGAGLDARYGATMGCGDCDLLPEDSQALDQKMDDGMPLTGLVQARYCYTRANIMPAADNSYAGGCTTSAGRYNVTSTYQACHLRVGAGF